MNTQMLEKRLWTSPVGAAVTRRILRPVVQLGGPLDVDADVLHIGSGSGRVAEALAQAHPQWRITALDSDPRMVAAAHHRLYRYGPRMRITRADPPVLPYPDASFDLVIAAYVWHRLTAWRPVAVEAARVLRPRGILVVADGFGIGAAGVAGGKDGPSLTPMKVAVTAAGLSLVDAVAIPGLGYRLLALRHVP